MISASSNFGALQQRLIEAARRLAEARAVQRSAPDNTANWRSARWLWPNLGPNLEPTIGQE
jgi:hypothetical protein